MHYYQFNIGDYRRDTQHLTPLEHGIYRLLLDQHYLTEKPIDANALRLLCIRSAEEVNTAKNILNEFFVLTDDGSYIHLRCMMEIEKFKEKSEKAKTSAKARWDANAMRTHSEGNANHKPITINQEPIKKKSENKFSDEDLSTAKHIFALLRQMNSRHKEPNLNQWAATIRLMRDRDNRTSSEIRELFSWANNHHFWKANILSPVKLREKWDQLLIQKQSTKTETKGVKNDNFNDREYRDSGLDDADWAK